LAAASESPKGPSPREKKRLPTSKLLILYFISLRGSYDGTIMQLSRDMGYPTDSNVNKNLNELIRDGYVVDKPLYKLTQEGVHQLQFTRLPEALCYILLVLGITEMLVSAEGAFGLVIGRLTALGSFGLGVAIVVVAVLFLRLTRRVYGDFLGLRKPLSPTESAPREDREPDSSS